MPEYTEAATLYVAGFKFEDWETVWVQRRYNEPDHNFRFTAAERDDPEYFTLMKFIPGDSCEIELAGQLAVSGVILTRQIAYEATNHQVMLIGKGRTFWAATSSVIHDTMDFSNKNVLQIAKEVWAPHPVGVKVIGQLDLRPFESAHAEQGETTWDFVERLCRPRGVILGSDHLGNFLMIGEHTGEVVHHLIEGVNILRMQCVISKQQIYHPYIVSGQTKRSDESSPRQAGQQRAQTDGTAPLFRPRLTPAEQPVADMSEIQARSRNEAKWGEGTSIEATVTVQGWLNPSTNKLWEPGELIQVDSPMALLSQALKIEIATFTQDRNSGSLTTLELKAPWALNDSTNANVGNAGAPQAPGEAKNTLNDMPQIPPAHNPDNPAGEITERGG